MRVIRRVKTRGSTGVASLKASRPLPPMAERGTHELKGVPGEWHIFAVASR